MMKKKMVTIFLLVIVIIISMIFLFFSSRFISYSLCIQNRPLQATPRLESISLLIFKLMSSKEEPMKATTDNIHNSKRKQTKRTSNIYDCIIVKRPISHRRRWKTNQYGGNKAQNSSACLFSAVDRPTERIISVVELFE